MYFLFSGEGSTDMGKGRLQDRICEGNDYELGPMAMIVDQVVKHRTGCSVIQEGQYGFAPKNELIKKAKAARPGKKGMTLPGVDREKETAYFYHSARAFGTWAKKIQEKRREVVVAVLFRDCDKEGQDRGVWQHKWNSMLDGFTEAAFNHGVPMLPKPISEAWLLCALKNNPYQNCDALEKRSSSPKAKKPLKNELDKVCDGTDICSLVKSGRVNALKIDMPSFNAFKEKLLEVI